MISRMLLPTFMLFILALSGCVTNFPFSYRSKVTVYEETLTDDIAYTFEVYPSSVYEGEKVKIRVKLVPKKTLKNVNISVVDPCIFTIPENRKKTITLGDLSANTQRIAKFELRAPETVEMNTKCKIKFKISYEASFSAISDVVVLSEAEYKERASSGTLNDIKISSSKTPSAVEARISFSEEQPFRDGEEVFMSVEYLNIGNGIPDKIEKNNIKINLPQNLEVEECSDYSGENELTLSKNIEFYEKKGGKSVCKLRAKANVPIDIGKLSISVKYKYEIEDYISVEVLP